MTTRSAKRNIEKLVKHEASFVLSPGGVCRPVNTFSVLPDNRVAVAGLIAKASLSLCRDKCFALALR